MKKHGRYFGMILRLEMNRLFKLLEKDEYKKFSNDDWMFVKKGCEDYARSRNRARDSEDFFGFVSEKILRGHSVHLQTAFIDYLRKYYGDTRNTCGALRSQERHAQTPEDFDFGSIRDDTECIQPDQLFDRKTRINENQNKIKYVYFDYDLDDIILILLRQKCGLTFSKIGDYLGVSRARISQKVSKLRL